jgi:hypothetical protein
MKTFADYLTESKKTYKFKIGIAGELPEGCMDAMETALQKFGVINMTDCKRTPITERPLDFPQLQNTEVNYCEAELAYPTIAPVVAEYLTQTCGLPESHLIVRNLDAPQEQYQDAEYNKIYEPNLGSDLPESDPAVHKTVTGERIMGLLAELEQARKERENDPIGSVAVNKEQIQDMGEPGNTSPMGSK